MANETKPPSTEELDAMAFEIFSRRAVNGRRAGEREAIEAYRQAALFMSVRDKHRKGGLKEKEDSPLSPACAPNLPKTHPINLVAKQHTDRRGVKTAGDLTKVREIHSWLSTHLKPDTDQDEFLAEFSAAFPNLNWDMPTVNVARAIFPDYVKN